MRGRQIIAYAYNRRKRARRTRFCGSRAAAKRRGGKNTGRQAAWRARTQSHDCVQPACKPDI